MIHLWLALREFGLWLISNPWRTVAIILIVLIVLFLRAWSRAWRSWGLW